LFTLNSSSSFKLSPESFICGIAYPVRIDSSAIQDPERINISQGIDL
jgi:hypothetical protein